MFLIYHVNSRDHMFKLLCDLKFLTVSHHSVKFSGHSPCGSGDTAAKIFYVILQDHGIKGSGDLMEESFS